MRAKSLEESRKEVEPDWDYLPTRRFRDGVIGAGGEYAGPVVAVRTERLAHQGEFPSMVEGNEPLFFLETRDGSQERMEQRYMFHKSNGMEFGYGGSGPAAFAFNVLALVLEPKEAWRFYQDFKAAYVARIPREGGRIDLADVVAWVRQRWVVEENDPALMEREKQQAADVAEMKRLDALAEQET